MLGTAGGNGHQGKNICRWQGCGPPNNTFRGGSPPLRHTLTTGPNMNYAQEKKDSGIQKIHEVAGSRRGTGGRVTRRILYFKNIFLGAVP